MAKTTSEKNNRKKDYTRKGILQEKYYMEKKLNKKEIIQIKDYVKKRYIQKEIYTKMRPPRKEIT